MNECLKYPDPTKPKDHQDITFAQASQHAFYAISMIPTHPSIYTPKALTTTARSTTLSTKDSRPLHLSYTNTALPAIPSTSTCLAPPILSHLAQSSTPLAFLRRACGLIAIAAPARAFRRVGCVLRVDIFAVDVLCF